jgi:hypothetical protein
VLLVELADVGEQPGEQGAVDRVVVACAHRGVEPELARELRSWLSTSFHSMSRRSLRKFCRQALVRLERLSGRIESW